MRHVNDGWAGTTIDVDTTGKAYIPVGRQVRDTAGTWAGQARKRVANMGRGTPSPMPRPTAGGLPPGGALVRQPGPGAMGGGALARNSGQAAMGFGKLAGRAAPVLFAGLDYATGKAEGEDDIRALAGAGGALVGGMKGAATGAALGSVAGPVGTIVGGLIGGAAGSFAGGWGADRIDDVVRGRPKTDTDTAPDTRLGMMGGAVSGLAGGGNNVNPWAMGKAAVVGAGVLGAGVGAKGIYDNVTGDNEFNQRMNSSTNQFQRDSNALIDRDVQQGIYVGERAGQFNRGLERDRMNQEYQNQYGLQGQQLASNQKMQTESLRASQAQSQLEAFGQAQNTAAQRAASILGTRFY